MDSTLNDDRYIPYKFYDNDDEGMTEIHCRNVKNSDYRKFRIKHNPWLIVHPYKDSTESQEDTIMYLQEYFKTSTVVPDENNRYLIRNFNLDKFVEDDFKSVTFLPNNYTAKITANKNRFYNLFSFEGEWLDERGDGYSELENNHILVKIDRHRDIVYKRHTDETFKLLDSSEWKRIEKTTDIIFTFIEKEEFTRNIGVVDNRIDYAFITPEWNTKGLNINEWYDDNISDIYQLSFMSSRNISDIVNIDSKKKWEYITDDILLSVSISLFETNKIYRFNKDHCKPGKYKNVYFYNIGDFLLELLQNTACKETLHIWKKFSHLSKWNNIISNIFSYRRLNPIDFTLMDSYIYMDSEYLVTTVPLNLDIPNKKIDYMIALNEGSYLLHDSSNGKTIFKGTHYLCRPKFPSVRKAISDYMKLNALGHPVNICMLFEILDKDQDNLKIRSNVNIHNLDLFRNILSEELISDLESKKIISKDINTWMSEKGLTTKFNETETVEVSGKYIMDILNSLDKIE